MTNFVVNPGPERRHRKQELIKLMAARSDFSGSKHACEMLLQHAPEPGSDLNYPLVVAATVCYSRPFTANEPYGALPKRYARSLDDPRREFHSGVIEARHKFFAHSDLNDRSAYICPPGSLIARKPSELRGSGIGSALGSILYHPDFFQKLRLLSLHMGGLVNADIEDLLQELYGGMDLPAAKFKLRIDNGL